MMLCKFLPSSFAPQLTAQQLLLFVSNAIAVWDAGALSWLAQLQAASQVSTGDLMGLLLRAMRRLAAQMSTGCKDEFGRRSNRNDKKLAQQQTLLQLQEREAVLLELLALAAAQQLTADDVMALLQCSVSHGLLVITRRLCTRKGKPWQLPQALETHHSRVAAATCWAVHSSVSCWCAVRA
jgi:hypothetical protein